ncbi:TetR/AcrR family transcriptional regulator [Pseudonocardia sp. GCM10023141]|uniref:TetR/AcrR family transcriptional regulator n=1 Tax=Pseudonocardia sp. GCM10023141 TaxID=3252653 RepID=UPI003613E76D
MGRVSRAQAQEHREQVVAAASRLFRERGVPGVSVADLMAEVGLTHGGFYRQFPSKQALVTEATALAFTDLEAQFEGHDAAHPDDHAAAREDLVDYYLSVEHRDDPGHGCPTAGFGPDLGREDDVAEARVPYSEGVSAFARWMSDDPEVAGAGDLAAVCTLVGAILLARATVGSDVSEDILRAARAVLGER